jgi:hypothetical protein
MRIFGRALITALCVAGVVAASAVPTFADEKGNLTDFSSMTAISVGGTVVRGITGGGLPWAITSGTGTVRFDATVPGGNSHITATVDLPRPCIHPIVFVGVFPSGRWFAMSNPDAQP